MEEKKKKTPIWLIVVIVILIILIIGSFGNSENTNKDTSNNKENTEEKQNDNYMTFLEWTNSGKANSDEQIEWLKVAIENDNYDGDVLKSGTYTVEQTDGEYDGTPQRTYNLYVTDLNTENPDEVQNNSIPITVGGVNGSNSEITVQKGQYLYVQKVSGGEIGHLKLKLK